MKNVLLVNLSIALIGGIVSGLAVFVIIEYIERKRWDLVKKQLVELLNITMNWILTTIRSVFEVSTPLKIYSDDDYTAFFEQEVLNKFAELKLKIKYIDREKQDILLLRFHFIQDSLRQLEILFTSLKASNPWYMNTIFDIQKKIFNALLPYLTFPEIGKPEYQNDEKLSVWKEMAFENIYELCKYVIEAKKNPLIKNVINEIFRSSELEEM